MDMMLGDRDLVVCTLIVSLLEMDLIVFLVFIRNISRTSAVSFFVFMRNILRTSAVSFSCFCYVDRSLKVYT